MIRWKDFFYFNKGDKIAIILLSVLICCAGLVAVYVFGFADTDSSYTAGMDLAKRGFVEFENDMRDADLVESEEVTPEAAEKPARKTTAKKMEKGQTVDINKASAESLKRIPGIGNTLAERIVAYRSELGGYASLEQLQEVKGITVNKFSGILSYLLLKEKHRKMQVNNVGEDKLLAHPYLNEEQVETIVSLRQSRKIGSMDDLTATGFFTARDVARLQAYLAFD